MFKTAKPSNPAGGVLQLMKAPRAVSPPPPFQPGAAASKVAVRAVQPPTRPVPPRPAAVPSPHQAALQAKLTGPHIAAPARHARQDVIIQPFGRSTWGPPGSKAGFLVGKDDGKTTAEHFPTLGGIAAPTSIRTVVPTVEQKWQATPVTSTVVATPPDTLVAIKSKISSWSKKAHAGSKARLREDEIKTLTDWAEGQKSTSGKSAIFHVVRGEGTGDYAAADQLKIIAIFSTAIGDKQPTYHISLV